MQYLFYRLWQILIGKSDEFMPPFGATLIICLIQGANIATLHVLISHFFNIKYHYTSENDIIFFSLIPNLSVMIFNFLYLFRRRNLIKLKYENESKIKRTIGNISLLVYGFVSMLLLVFFGSLYPIVSTP